MASADIVCQPNNSQTSTPYFSLHKKYTFSTIDPKDGPYPNRGSCVFVQTSVMRSGSSRDGRQQSRLIRGNKDGFEICTVDHKDGGKIRLDATITYRDDTNEVGVYAHGDIADSDEKFFRVYQPSAGDELHPPDEGYIGDRWTEDGTLLVVDEITQDTKAWWNMACGRVLGMLNGMLIEYDPSTLAPLGLIVGADELVGKKIAVIDSGLEECMIDDGEGNAGMEGAECEGMEAREQAVLLIDEADGQVTVVQPNEDGSYWRKIVRNKMIRMKEARRIKAAKAFAEDQLKLGEEAKVVPSWGPYMSTSGTAKKTGVAGLTTKAENM